MPTFDKMRQGRIGICAAAVLMILIGSFPAIAQQVVGSEKVLVVGSSAVQSGNAASAREKAEADALRTAVEQVAIRMLPPAFFAENFSGLVRKVFSKPEQFVETYKVVTEVGLEKSYEVLVEVTVSRELLQQGLHSSGIVGEKEKTDPKVFVVLIEKALNGPEPPAWVAEDSVYYQSAAEDAMKSALEQKGITIVNRGPAAKKLENVVIPFTPDYDLKDVLALGGRLEADIVVIGRAAAEIIPNVMQGNLKSYKGWVRIEGFRVDTGQKIAESEESTVKTHSDEQLAGPDVLAAAGQMAGDQIADQIASQWRNSAETVRFDIIVDGTRQLANFVQFRRMIEAIPAVKNMLIKEKMPDQAILMVEAAGGPKKLADAIMVESFDSFGVDITSLTDNRMKVTLIPK